MNFSDKLLVIDTETSGLPNHNAALLPYVTGPQCIELGAVLVAPNRQWTILDTFETKIRFLGRHGGIEYGEYPDITWDDYAETIHGLSKRELAREPHPFAAAEGFVKFLQKHYSVNERVTIAGHNPGFDIYHARQLLFLGGLIDRVKFDHRMVDTNTIGMLLYGIKHSDDLFSKIGKVVRDKHKALEDALAALAVLQETSRRLEKSNFVTFTSE